MGMNPKTEQLTTFFRAIRSRFVRVGMEERLPKFFNSLRDVLTGALILTSPEALHPGDKIDIDRLKCWFTLLNEPIESAKRGGFLCDPWQIASLKKDEVRTSRVLAWLLSPRGTHGYGCIFLKAVLLKVGDVLAARFLPDPSHSTVVRTETCPDGGRENRVDIEIDDPAFYLIIEVKICAPEGEQQIERYAQIAQCRAGNRPWGVVYLNPPGKSSYTAGKWKGSVATLSWKMLAFLISDALKKRQRMNGKYFDAHQRVTSLLLSTFVRHIRRF